MEDALRRILVAGAFVVALAFPAGAAAWTPQDCADWYETHGSNHPDCQDYVPPAPPVETPPPVTEQPPAPPVDTPPAVTVPTPPADVPVTPVDTPDVIPAPTPKVGHRAPNRVEGKEQQGKVTAPPQEAVVDTRTTLPFSGLSVGAMFVAGLVLLMFGYATRRALT